MEVTLGAFGAPSLQFAFGGFVRPMHYLVLLLVEPVVVQQVLDLLDGGFLGVLRVSGVAAEIVAGDLPYQFIEGCLPLVVVDALHEGGEGLLLYCEP